MAPIAAAVLAAGPAARAAVRTEIGAAPAARKARPVKARPVKRKPVRTARPAVRQQVEQALLERARARPAGRSRIVRQAAVKSNRPVVKSNAAMARAQRMARVVAFARSKVGARYGTSRGRYDCSKLVQFAYRSAGISLPRQSKAIAARAYTISWRSAKPGDIIVGRGHVGIYMGKRGGRHMMIDSGNSRVGVSYREVYFNSQGLHPERVAVG